MTDVETGLHCSFQINSLAIHLLMHPTATGQVIGKVLGERVSLFLVAISLATGSPVYEVCLRA